MKKYNVQVDDVAVLNTTEQILNEDELDNVPAAPLLTTEIVDVTDDGELFIREKIPAETCKCNLHENLIKMILHRKI